MYAVRPLFGQYRRSSGFDPGGFYSYWNVPVGDDVNLGVMPTLMAELSEIQIGNEVMFGPEVMVIAGGHNIVHVGKAMIAVSLKTGDEDLGVAFQDDFWVGTRAMILRGVTSGGGSAVGAGAVVTKGVPPYASVGGNLAKVLDCRFGVDAVLAHESLLYPVAARFSRSEVEAWQQERVMLEPFRRRAR